MKSSNQIISETVEEQWFNKANELLIEHDRAIAFQGSWRQGGIYPDWILEVDIAVPHILNDGSSPRFKDICSAIGDNAVSEVDKINRIHLFISQLVCLPLSVIKGVEVSAGHYRHIEKSKDASAYCKEQQLVVKKFNSSAPSTISETDAKQYPFISGNILAISNDQLSEYPFMPASIHIKNRFADCRVTNALFAYGLQLAGIKGIRWTYIKPQINFSKQGRTYGPFNDDHAIVLWKKNDTVYVLDSYFHEFHGLKLKKLLKGDGVMYKSAYAKYKEGFKEKYKASNVNKLRNAYMTLGEENATLFSTPIKVERYPGLQCYHSTHRLMGSHFLLDTLSYGILEQNNYPKKVVVSRK